MDVVAGDTAGDPEPTDAVDVEAVGGAVELPESVNLAVIRRSWKLQRKLAN